MTLAVHHPTGATHDVRGRRLLNEFAKKHGWEVRHGPEDQPAPIDAILVSGDHIIAVVEVRTRVTHSLDAIERMGGTYLITHQKLLDLMEGGRLFGVPSFLVVGLACGTRWGWRIGNREGTPYFSWDTERTRTRATSLDASTTVRLNAYIPLRHGVQW